MSVTLQMTIDIRVLSQELASTPPRGWNSYNAISWTITEKEFLQNAEIISKKLLPHGYEVCCVLVLFTESEQQEFDYLS